MLVRLAEVNFINDKAGKPVGIQQHIGRRAIAAFGNSDGDFEMLAWTSKAPEPKAAADRIRTDSHVVTVSDVRPATKPRDIESACEGQATTIVVCNSCAPANGLAAKGNRGHDARE